MNIGLIVNTSKEKAVSCAAEIITLLGGAGAYTYFQLRAEYHVTYDGYTATRGTISNSLPSSIR